MNASMAGLRAGIGRAAWRILFGLVLIWGIGVSGRAEEPAFAPFSAPAPSPYDPGTLQKKTTPANNENDPETFTVTWVKGDAGIPKNAPGTLYAATEDVQEGNVTVRKAKIKFTATKLKPPAGDYTVKCTSPMTPAAGTTYCNGACHPVGAASFALNATHNIPAGFHNFQLTHPNKALLGKTVETTIVNFIGLIVDGATQRERDDFLTPSDGDAYRNYKREDDINYWTIKGNGNPDDNVYVIAVLNPFLSPKQMDDLPDNFISWDGGQNTISACMKKIQKGLSGKFTVKATVNNKMRQVDIWVLWATIEILTTGTPPENSVRFSECLEYDEATQKGEYDGTENLGVVTFITNEGHLNGRGKICAVATVSPENAHTTWISNWALKREKNVYGTITYDNYITTINTGWRDDDSDTTTTLLDGENKIYDIDAPNTPEGGNATFRKINFKQWLEFKTAICSDKENSGKWKYTGRWEMDGIIVEEEKDPITGEVRVNEVRGEVISDHLVATGNFETL